MPQAQGTFEVKVAPLPADDAIAATSISRFSLDKVYRGDIEGISAGEMMGAGNVAAGSAGYVAVEQVSGTVHGKHGSFALQHSSTMDQGQFDMNIKVVPGSGTEQLVGIAGVLTIIIDGKQHSYRFDYTLPAES